MNYYPSTFFNVIAKTDLSNRLWSTLINKDIIKSLIEKADHGRPSIEAVDLLIESNFGNEIDNHGKSKSDLYKRMIGHMVGQIMMNQGYKKNIEKDLSNCRYFTKGCVFTK